MSIYILFGYTQLAIRHTNEIFFVKTIHQVNGQCRSFWAFLCEKFQWIKKVSFFIVKYLLEVLRPLGFKTQTNNIYE